MKKAALIILLCVVAVVSPLFFPNVGRDEGVNVDRYLPWNITVNEAGQTEVLGIVLGQSTLREVKRLWGEDIDLAIIASGNESGSLEGYYTELKLGFVLAKVVLTLSTHDGEIDAMRTRAVAADYMKSGAKKIRLGMEDRNLAEDRTVVALSVIPTVNLDEAALVSRFGTPAERFAVSPERVHLLYPAQGLDIVVDTKGKELLQYVAPQNFAQLVAPVKAQITQGVAKTE